MVGNIMQTYQVIFTINNKIFHNKDEEEIKGRQRFEREQGDYKSGIGLRKKKGGMI